MGFCFANSSSLCGGIFEDTTTPSLYSALLLKFNFLKEVELRLLHQHHPLRLGKSAGLQLIKVNAVRFVARVPNNPMGSYI